jgi:hypothetical protein
VFSGVSNPAQTPLLSPIRPKPKAWSQYPGGLDGQFLEAVKIQTKAINELAKENKSNFDEIHRLCLYLTGVGDFKSALQLLQDLKKKKPTDLEILHNLGFILLKLGQFSEAIEEYKIVLQLDPNRIDTYDSLASIYSKLKDIDRNRYYGQISLLLKDRAAELSNKAYPLPQKPPKSFNWNLPSKNIISFSLWGDNPRYCQGALRNATLAPDIYPSWQCRFYCDNSVPAEVLDKLRVLGSEVLIMNKPKNFYDGLFWRFLVAEDTTIERFLVRDCDAVINIKERLAVDEWLESDRYFHVMRDYYTHTEIVLAGMWGGVAGALPSITSILKKFHPKTQPTRTYDQLFLREEVWPTMRQSCLIHDSIYRVLNAKDFPVWGQLPSQQHIGQNEWAMKQINLN